jgi:WD40 repeat protein
MTQAVFCPACHKPLRLQQNLLGKRVRCPSCRAAFVLEAAPESDDLDALPVEPEKQPAARSTPRLQPTGQTGGRNAARPRQDRSEPPPAFTVIIKDPDGVWRGRFAARLTGNGLRLTQKETSLTLPIGSSARYVSGNVLEVSCEDRAVRLSVKKWFSYQNRLARDLAAYLERRAAMPRAADYALPWYFYLPIALPIGIPLITVGGALPSALGFGLAGTNFAIVQRERLATAVRLTASVALTICGYAALALFLWLAGKGSSTDANWMTFSPNDGSFSVLLPGQAKVSTETQQAPVGPITTVTHMVDLKHSAYIVSYSIIPAAGLATPLETQLDAVRDRMLASKKGRLLHEDRITFHGHPGRELSLEMINPRGGGVVRFFRVGDRLYQLLVMGTNITSDSPQARKFLESFALSAAEAPSPAAPGNPPATPPDQPALAVPRDSNARPQLENHADKGYLELKGLAGETRALAYTSNGRTLAVAAGPAVVLFDPANGTEGLSLRDGDETLLAMALAPNGHWLATGSDRGRLQVWDLSKRQVRVTLEERADTILLALVFAPTSATLAVGWSDGSVRLWDVEPWAERTRLRGPVSDLVRSVAISRDGKFLVSQCTVADQVIRLWDLSSYQERTHFPGGSGNPFGNCLAFAPDGRSVAAFKTGPTLKFIDVGTGIETFTQAVSADTRCLALSPDGRLVASGDASGHVRVYNWMTGRGFHPPSNIFGGAAALAFSADSRSLAVGGLSTVHIWDLSKTRALDKDKEGAR